MTVQSIKGVGYCALMTEVGDRALAVALECAQRHEVRLDIFFFPTSSFDAHDSRGRHGETAHLSSHDVIELERQTRLYYDERLGDYLNVGFRFCLGDEDPELRRCLLYRKDYDVLVLPCPTLDCSFGGRPVLAFAQHMPCPVILVGPEDQGQLLVNSAAQPLLSVIMPPGTRWAEIPV